MMARLRVSFVCALLLSAIVWPNSGYAFRKVALGAEVPNVALKTLEGKTPTLFSADTKVHIFIFFRPNQEYSRTTLAALAQLDRNALIIQESTPGRMEGHVALVVGGVEIYLPLAGLVDVEKERLRLEKELAEMQSQAQRLEQLLAGPFAQKAPPPVVQKERDKLAVINETMQKLAGQLESFS